LAAPGYVSIGFRAQLRKLRTSAGDQFRRRCPPNPALSANTCRHGQSPSHLYRSYPKLGIAGRHLRGLIDQPAESTASD